MTTRVGVGFSMCIAVMHHTHGSFFVLCPFVKAVYIETPAEWSTVFCFCLWCFSLFVIRLGWGVISGLKRRVVATRGENLGENLGEKPVEAWILRLNRRDKNICWPLCWLRARAFASRHSCRFISESVICLSSMERSDSPLVEEHNVEMEATELELWEDNSSLDSSSTSSVSWFSGRCLFIAFSEALSTPLLSRSSFETANFKFASSISFASQCLTCSKFALILSPARTAAGRFDTRGGRGFDMVRTVWKKHLGPMLLRKKKWEGVFDLEIQIYFHNNIIMSLHYVQFSVVSILDTTRSTVLATSRDPIRS